MTQEEKPNPIESALGPSPVPDPEGCRIFVQNEEGALEAIAPRNYFNRVDPLAKTEAVSGTAKPKTFLERLRDLVGAKVEVELVMASGKTEIGSIIELTEDLIVLEADAPRDIPNRGRKSHFVIRLDKIESFSSDS